MKLWVQAEVDRLTNQRRRRSAKAGNPGPEMSIAKLAYSEFNKALYEFCIDLMGADALVGYDYTFRRPDDLDVDGHHARHPPRVPAGAGQLDRGRHVGDHAQHPRRAGARPARRAPVDKSVPWNEVRRLTTPSSIVDSSSCLRHLRTCQGSDPNFNSRRRSWVRTPPVTSSV